MGMARLEAAARVEATRVAATAEATRVAALAVAMAVVLVAVSAVPTAGRLQQDLSIGCTRPSFL